MTSLPLSGRVTLLRDVPPNEWWCEVAAPGQRPGTCAAMFTVYAATRTEAERQLRVIGQALAAAVIEPGLVSCQVMFPWPRQHGPDDEGDIPF